MTGAVASTYEEGEDAFDIRVQLAKTDRTIAEDVNRILIRTKKGLVQLSALGDLIERTGETQIARKDKQKMFVIEANILSGSLADATREIQQRIRSDGAAAGLSDSVWW